MRKVARGDERGGQVGVDEKSGQVGGGGQEIEKRQKQ